LSRTSDDEGHLELGLTSSNEGDLELGRSSSDKGDWQLERIRGDRYFGHRHNPRSSYHLGRYGLRSPSVAEVAWLHSIPSNSTKTPFGIEC